MGGGLYGSHSGSYGSTGGFAKRVSHNSTQPVSGKVGTKEEGRAAIAKLVAEAPRKLSWFEQGMAWIAALPTAKEFTSDDLIEAIGLPWEEVKANRNNAVGMLFQRAAKVGLIRKTYLYLPSRRKTNHGAVIMTWARTKKGTETT